PFKVGGSYALRPGFAMEGRRSIPDRGSNGKKSVESPWPEIRFGFAGHGRHGYASRPWHTS
ncbi:MAG TPA: hypothetical protein VHN73_04135, partial [Phenylobacterium sp.]|nr:hypothetical protein [Phenylobacterium sp.]